MRVEDADISVVLQKLADERTGKTFCPSEAARRLDPVKWRELMPDVRRVGAKMGLRATQRGVDVDALKARGPIRFSK